MAPRDSGSSRSTSSPSLPTALVLLAAAIMLLLVFAYGAGTGPDERSHMGYVRALASHGRLPTQTEAQFAIQHPPAYYLPAAVLALVTPSWAEYTVVRLFSVALAVGTIMLAAAAAREAFGRDTPVAPLTIVLIAGTPLWLHNNSFVNNDAGVGFVYALLVLLAVRLVVRGPSSNASLLLGAVAGVGVLTKTTTLPGIGVALLAQFLAHRLHPSEGHRRLRDTALTLGVWLPLALPWPLYLISRHGDVLGTYGVNHPPFHGLSAAQWASIPDKYLVSLAALFRQDPGPLWTWALRAVGAAVLVLLVIAGVRWVRDRKATLSAAVVVLVGAALGGLAVALYNLHTLYDSAFDPNGKSSLRYALHAFPAFAVIVAGAVYRVLGDRRSRVLTAVLAVTLPVVSLGLLSATVGIRLR